MFLTSNDYKTVCSIRELDVLQQSDVETREKAEQAALEEVASYLRTRYDIKKAYACQGDERNPFLVQICANVTLFYLAQWLPQKMASGNRTLMYENAIVWLKGVQNGKSSPDLPLYTDIDGNEKETSFPIATGSMKRNTYDW